MKTAVPEPPRPAEAEGASELHDGAWARLYASVYLFLLLSVAGGALTVWIARSAIWTEQRRARGDYLPHRPEGIESLFYYLGITDWRVHFAIGAGLGALVALLYLKRSKRV